MTGSGSGDCLRSHSSCSGVEPDSISEGGGVTEEALLLKLVSICFETVKETLTDERGYHLIEILKESS